MPCRSIVPRPSRRSVAGAYPCLTTRLTSLEASRAVSRALFLGRRERVLAFEPRAPAGGEHRPLRRLYRRERDQSQRRGCVDVDRLDPAAQKIGPVPEAGTAGIAREPPPPFLTRVRAGPTFESVEVAPVLAHPAVRWNQRVPERFVPERPVGMGVGGALYLLPDLAQG